MISTNTVEKPKNPVLNTDRPEVFVPVAAYEQVNGENKALSDELDKMRKMLKEAKQAQQEATKAGQEAQKAAHSA